MQIHLDTLTIVCKQRFLHHMTQGHCCSGILWFLVILLFRDRTAGNPRKRDSTESFSRHLFCGTQQPHIATQSDLCTHSMLYWLLP